MPSTRIALCSDTHFWPGATRRYGHDENQLQPWSEEIQTALLDDLETAAPDLIIHLGDLTCGGGHFEMPADQFYKTVSDTIAAFQALPADFYGLPGNHDCPAKGDWSFADQALGLEPGLGQLIDLPAARLVTLHSQGHPREMIDATWPRGPNHGWVSPAELARLDEALATAGDRPVIMFSHQLLQPWIADTPPWDDLYGIINAAEVLALLARYGNVRAVFQGHAHRIDVQQAPLGQVDCWFVVAPAIIEYPMSWMELELQPTAIQVNVRQLPLLELAQISRDTGQAWRAGRPQWENYAIPL